MSEKKIYDLIIIGAGTAGMTAAIYALRAKKSVLILEETVSGGQIINTYKIENYPGIPSITGLEFAQALKSQVEHFGGAFEYSKIEKIEKSNNLFSLKSSDDEEFFAKTVIIANGSKERKIGLKNEESLTGRGLSYCATCDGSFFKEKTVAVYGGGNTALYSALYLASLAKKVYLIIRRDKFRAEPHLVKKAEAAPNIEIIKNSVITSLNGTESLESITLEPASSQNSSKTLDNPENLQKTLKLDGLFVSIGRTPDNNRFENLLDLDEQGYIKSDESCKTRTPGLFCAGDTRAKTLHQLVTATSDGAVAATAAVEFLNSELK